MKIIFNMGWWLERSLDKIAQDIIDSRTEIPKSLEKEHEAWVEVVKTYIDEPSYARFAARYDGCFRKISTSRSKPNKSRGEKK